MIDNNDNDSVVTDNDVEILAPVENTNTNWESFFKNNPTKVLGTEKEVTTKFGKKLFVLLEMLKCWRI